MFSANEVEWLEASVRVRIVEGWNRHQCRPIALLYVALHDVAYISNKQDVTQLPSVWGQDGSKVGSSAADESGHQTMTTNWRRKNTFNRFHKKLQRDMPQMQMSRAGVMHKATYTWQASIGQLKYHDTIATSRSALRRVRDSPRTGSGLRIAHTYKWREQATAEWSRRVISNNACEPGQQLTVLANGDTVGWSLLLLAATVWNFVHLPLETTRSNWFYKLEPDITGLDLISKCWSNNPVRCSPIYRVLCSELAQNILNKDFCFVTHRGWWDGSHWCRT